MRLLGAQGPTLDLLHEPKYRLAKVQGRTSKWIVGGRQIDGHLVKDGQAVGGNEQTMDGNRILV